MTLTREQVEVLMEHVARLEGLISVMLEEAEKETLQKTAAEIRAALPTLDD